MKHFAFIFFLLMLGACSGGSASSPQLFIPTDVVSVGGEVPMAETPTTPEDDLVPEVMSSPSGDEVIVGLSQGTSAPFSGVLLNAAAAAWLEAEPDAVQERCQLFVSRRLGETRIMLGAEISRLQLHITTLQSVHQIELENRDTQIASLMRINDELRNSSGQWWEQALWVGGALIVGAAIGIIFALVAN